MVYEKSCKVLKLANLPLGKSASLVSAAHKVGQANPIHLVTSTDKWCKTMGCRM